MQAVLRAMLRVWRRLDRGHRPDRRVFLASSLGAAAAFAAGLPAVAAPVARGRRDLAPGEVVRVEWPRWLDSSSARLVHELDGRVLSRTPVPPARGILLPRIEVVAMPADGRMRAGRHDFFLEVEGSGTRLWLGGFGVARFRFGC